MDADADRFVSDRPPSPHPRLCCDGREVVSIEVAGTRRARRKGLLGRSGIDGAMWFPRTAWIHTLRMRFAIDVAWCADDGSVRRAATVVPNRLTRPVFGARTVVEAAAGSFARWGIAAGSRLEVSSAEAEDAGEAEDGEAGEAAMAGEARAEDGPEAGHGRAAVAESADVVPAAGNEPADGAGEAERR